MILTGLELVNFRNHTNFKIDLEENINIIKGFNWLGKTNILEAINILSIAKSFRNLPLKKCIQNQANFARIKASFFDNGEKKDLLVVLDNIDKYQTVYQKNDQKLGAVDFVGQFKSIVFFPEELNIFILDPDYRRRYFDKILCQIDKKYWLALTEYRKVLFSRNKILKNNFCINSSFKNEIYFWDNQLAKNGSYLVLKRKELISFFNKFLTEFYSQIADQKISLNITYPNQLFNKKNRYWGDFDDFMENINTFETGFSEKELNLLQNQYLEILKEQQKKDLENRTTSFGPHRDDFKIYLSKFLLKEKASRGEMRSVMLALKETEIKLLEDNFKTKPVLLLDDIFSELDNKRQQKVLSFMKDKQIIITTAENNLTNLKGKEICL